jgi:branched-chain amino acid transport system substrate-binding protein
MTPTFQPKRVLQIVRCEDRKLLRKVILIALLTTVSCGTRVDRTAGADAAIPQVTQPEQVSLSGDDTPPAAGDHTPESSKTSSTPEATEPSGTASGKATLSKTPQGGDATPARSVPSKAAPVEHGTVGGTQPSAGGSPSRENGGPPAKVPGTAGPRSEVNVASVGTYSGPLGVITTPILRGAQLWVKHINAKGGLNGHPVKMVVYDDGGDPARHRAATKEAVERQHAIAFFSNVEPITGSTKIEYINSKRVPVVGISSSETWAFTSPMYFPQASAGEGWSRSAIPSFAGQTIPSGKTKLGTLICVEATDCDTNDRIAAEMAKRFGYQHVYRARMTITQPDYSAECLAARNQQVEVFYVISDQNTLRRVALACARQGYRPIFAVSALSVDDNMKTDPNLAGLVAWHNVFPYFQTGTPASDEFQQAIRTYGNGISRGSGTSLGWVAGKLLEKAGADLPEPPTSEALLNGLWAIKNDTLDGLTAPLTFVRDQPPSPSSCWFNITIKDGAVVSPDAFERHCL